MTKKIVNEMARELLVGSKDDFMHENSIGVDETTVMLNEDGQEIPPRIDRPSRRPLLPVGVWARLEGVRCKRDGAVKIGNKSEQLWFHTKDYDMLLLTNRTIRVVDRATNQHAYVPCENVAYFHVLKDAAFERRFEKTGDKDAEGTPEAA